MPAMKARGAIVEKGEKGRKVIGDYLNSHPTPQKQLWEGAYPRLQWISHNICNRKTAIGGKPPPTFGYFLLLALAPRWRWASNRHTPVATDTLRLLTLPAIGRCTR